MNLQALQNVLLLTQAETLEINFSLEQMDQFSPSHNFLMCINNSEAFHPLFDKPGFSVIMTGSVKVPVLAMCK